MEKLGAAEQMPPDSNAQLIDSTGDHHELTAKTSASVRRREAIVNSAAGLEVEQPAMARIGEVIFGLAVVCLFCVMMVFVRRRIFLDVVDSVTRTDLKSA
mmetsp:Transcript_36162/g.88357  ORF Transcript_36162/g.88357 Transcript_36162/m.88357 type:complete len:100 (+) Transcript_36162:382-681(+)